MPRILVGGEEGKGLALVTRQLPTLCTGETETAQAPSQSCSGERGGNRLLVLASGLFSEKHLVVPQRSGLQFEGKVGRAG